MPSDPPSIIVWYGFWVPPPIDHFRSMIAPGSNDWASRNIANDGAIAVSKEEFIEMLRAAIDGTLTADELRDWMNLVLFNDIFEFEGEAIRDALDRVEESDEPGAELDTNEMIALLKSLH